MQWLAESDSESIYEGQPLSSDSDNENNLAMTIHVEPSGSDEDVVVSSNGESSFHAVAMVEVVNDSDDDMPLTSRTDIMDSTALIIQPSQNI